MARKSYFLFWGVILLYYFKEKRVKSKLAKKLNKPEET